MLGARSCYKCNNCPQPFDVNHPDVWKWECEHGDMTLCIVSSAWAQILMFNAHITLFNARKSALVSHGRIAMALYST